MDLEPRPLPSTGITRFRRYYGPLRHPKRPGLSLAGVRFEEKRPLTAWASRVALHLLVPTCRRQYPGGPLGLDRSWDGLFQPFPCTQRRRPSPSLRKVGDHIRRFEACSTFTRVTACRLAESPKRPVCLEGSDGFVSSPRRFDSYRLERPSCRVGIAPTEDQHLPFTAHAMPVFSVFPFESADVPRLPECRIPIRHVNPEFSRFPALVDRVALQVSETLGGA